MFTSKYLPLSYNKNYVVSKQYIANSNNTDGITYRGMDIYKPNLSTITYYAMGVADPYDIITIGY